MHRKKLEFHIYLAFLIAIFNKNNYNQYILKSIIN